MKTLILGTLLILTVTFFGCDNNPIDSDLDKSKTEKTYVLKCEYLVNNQIVFIETPNLCWYSDIERTGTIHIVDGNLNIPFETIIQIGVYETFK